MPEQRPPTSGENLAHAPSTITSSGTGSSRKHKSSLIHETEEEFGEVKDAKIATIDAQSSHDGMEIDDSGEASDGWDVLLRRLVRRRHVKQYFKDGVLYRESSLRKLGMDELFLDLIVVANVAAIGHELRGSFVGWYEVEKFFLLFQAIWFAWRENAFLWNVFTNVRDLPEKIGVLSMVAFLSGIGLGAHDAFDGATRWVSLSAFFATVNITIAIFVHSVRDPIQQGRLSPMYNTAVLYLLAAIPTVIPYLVAAIVGPGSERVVRNIWWVSFGVNVTRSPALATVFRVFLKRIPGRYVVAVNIESATEKLGLLTIIVLGESLLAILFEASEVLSKSDLGRLYLSAFFAIVIVFSLFTLYFDVDQRIMEGGVHAIRYNGYLGVVWNALHLFLQAFLILGATGIGLTFDEASLQQPTETNSRYSIRAESDDSEAVVFDSSDRWLFCAGVGASLYALMAISLCHKPSPHAKSRLPRRATRFVSAIAVILLPLAGERVTPLILLAIVSGILAAQAIFEFVLVEVDHLRFHGWRLRNSKEREGRSEEASAEDGAEFRVELEDEMVDEGSGLDETDAAVDYDEMSLEPCVYKKCAADRCTEM